jgi:cytochrome c biogenesis protein CcmG/thiol:disulfide interchange protein DsbE
MGKNKNLLIYLSYVVIVILLLLISFRIYQTKTTEPPPVLQPVVNLSVLSSTKFFTSQALQGKIYLLNIWASWCPACRSEHSVLMTIKKNNTVPIYGINYKDDIDNAIAWLKQEGNPYIAMDADTNGSLTNDLDIEGLPETFLIDQHGIIRYRIKGTLDINTWETILLPLINQLKNQ